MRPGGTKATSWPSRRRLPLAVLVAICVSALGAALPTVAVAAPPNNISPPTISGDAIEGETLTGDDGTWDDPNATFARQWQRSDGGYADIPGATGSTYVLTSDDVGHRIRLRVIANNVDGDSLEAFSDPTAEVAAAPGPEPEERSLSLFVSRRPELYKRATIRVEGSADPSLELWVYENVRGKACSETPAGQERGNRTVIAALPVDGAFDEQRRPRMKNPGRHSYCAYLGPDEDTASEASFTTRKVRKPLLRDSRAREAVADALRRHGFASRVVANLAASCHRRSRSEFECRFSSAFPGYLLRGGGSVELKKHLSYRFQVFVRGRSFVLTDENEGGLPG